MRLFLIGDEMPPLHFNSTTESSDLRSPYYVLKITRAIEFVPQLVELTISKKCSVINSETAVIEVTITAVPFKFSA